MPGRDDLVLAIAAYRVKRAEAPAIPAPGGASIEQMGRVSRAIAAFDAGADVFDVKVEAELVGRTAGTAELLVEGVLEDELEITAARAVSTLARGLGEQIMAANTPPEARPPEPGAQQG